MSRMARSPGALACVSWGGKSSPLKGVSYRMPSIFLLRRLLVFAFLGRRFLRFRRLRRGILGLARIRFRRWRAVASRALFPGVVGHIPARALELNCGRRQRLFHFSAAMRTFFQMRPRHALDFLGAPLALHALVFVKWHSCSSCVFSKRSIIARSFQPLASTPRAKLWDTRFP